MKQITITEQATGHYFTLYDNYLDTILRDFEGFEYPQTRPAIDDVAGPYGSVYITSKFGPRQFSISGDLVADDVFAQRRQMQKALRQTGTIKLLKFITYDDLALQCEAEVVKVINPYNHKVHTFLIEFVAPDWRFYSQEEITRTVGISSVMGGADLPFPELPFTLDSTSTESEVTNIITNEGDEVTDPVLKIYGPGTNFILENITTGKSFTLNTTLTGSDVVEVDVKNRTVVKNGTDNLYPDIEGDFWSLEPDENELRFFVESGSDLTTSLDVVYRHAYSGI
jgi:hypothetical protein